jgi:hypothetical protein
MDPGFRRRGKPIAIMPTAMAVSSAADLSIANNMPHAADFGFF